MIARLSWMTALVLAGASIAGCQPSAPPATAPPSTAAPAEKPSTPATPDRPSSSGNLAGTSWQLVKFSGSNDTTLKPDDRSKYTLTFQPDGSVVARIDCNRGHGTWKSAAPNQLQFGPLALTRMMCPPGSMHDRVAADWDAVRSYVVKDGHLFLSLMADGGVYEYEPVPAAPPPG